MNHYEVFRCLDGAWGLRLMTDGRVWQVLRLESEELAQLDGEEWLGYCNRMDAVALAVPPARIGRRP